MNLRKNLDTTLVTDVVCEMGKALNKIFAGQKIK